MNYSLYFSLLLLLLISACGKQADSSAAAAGPEEAVVVSDSVYLAKGKAIAAATFVTLSQNLQGAMQAGGVEEAVRYCNLAAYPLVDSLAKANEAHIRRTSTRVRNPKNTATAREKQVLADYAAAQAAGQTLAPRIVHLDEQTVGFYAPILAMDMCLKCHGTVGEELATADYALIQQLYPEDKAVGFAAGDLRGIWSIQLARQGVAAYE